jgi:hypothetical protein
MPRLYSLIVEVSRFSGKHLREVARDLEPYASRLARNEPGARGEAFGNTSQGDM